VTRIAIGLLQQAIYRRMQFFLNLKCICNWNSEQEQM